MASKLQSPHPELYLLLLFYRLTEEENEQLTARLSIAGELGRNIRHMLQLKAAQHTLAEPGLPTSSIYRMLKPYSSTSINACALACDSPAIRSRMELYLNELRYVKPSINGEDLKRLGLQPGPRMGKMLQALLKAKLDGKVHNREEEESLVRQWLEYN